MSGAMSDAAISKPERDGRGDRDEIPCAVSPLLACAELWPRGVPQPEEAPCVPVPHGAVWGGSYEPELLLAPGQCRLSLRRLGFTWSLLGI